MRMLLRFALTMAVMLIYSGTNCQYKANFHFATVQDTIPQAVSALLKSKLNEKKKSLAGSRGKEANFIFSLYEKQNERLTNYFNEDYFITDDELTTYLQSILDNILKSNPSLEPSVNVYAFREFSPNAFTFWDGTIGITLALLSRLENEDEIAFVICHEMAHYYARHADKRIHDLAKVNYDPDIEKQIKTIRSENYDQYTKLKKLYKDLALSIYSHTRNQEFQADSLGFVYFSHTSYRQEASVRLMEILDSIDTPQYKKSIDLKKVLSAKNYPFKDNWLIYSKSGIQHRSGDEDYGTSDTARTHPDCKRRAAALQKLIASIPPAVTISRVNDSVASRMILRSELELVHSEFHFKHYAKSLYIALALLDRFPDNVYLHAMIAESMYMIYVSQKTHRMGKSVPLPDSRYPESYDRLLSFLQQLRLMEVASLTYNFTIGKPESYFSDEEYTYAFWMVAHLPGSEVSPNLIKDDYLQRFPDGQYRRIISNTH